MTPLPDRRATATPAAGLPATVAVGVLLLTGCTAEAPQPSSVPVPRSGSTFAPDAAIYRYGYWGGIEGSSGSSVGWLDSGDSFEMTTGGSGQCLNEPVAIEVVAPNHLRVHLELHDDPNGKGCLESSILASYVLDRPAGIDPSLTVRFERTQADQSGSSSVYVDPLR